MRNLLWTFRYFVEPNNYRLFPMNYNFQFKRRTDIPLKLFNLFSWPYKYNCVHRIMLGLIIFTHENKWYVNSLWAFFPFAQWTQWTESYNTSAFLTEIYWLKTDTDLITIFKSFFSFSYAQHPSTCTDTIS